MIFALLAISFNTQPPEGGCPQIRGVGMVGQGVSTHSRPKAAAHNLPFFAFFCRVSTHSRPKAAATILTPRDMPSPGFNTQPPEGGCATTICLTRGEIAVSTHSRPKAAAKVKVLWVAYFKLGFNTQPPEGGCPVVPMRSKAREEVSTHSRPKAAA